MLLKSHILGAQPRTGGELTTESSLLAMVVLGPLMFGSTEPWSFQILVALAGIALLGTGVDLATRRDKPMRWHWAFVPIVAFLLLCAAQLMPLPAGLIGTLAPQSAEFWQHAGVDGAVPLSLYPHATRGQLALMLVVASVFFCVVQTYRRPEQVQLLLMAIVVGGGIAAALALGQNVMGHKAAWGLSPHGATVSGQYLHPFSGPFLNHSHFAQLANLTIGACFALLLVQVNQVLEGGTRRIWTRARDIARHPQLQAGRVIVFIAIATALALVLSLSRGGVLSMAIALGVTVAALTLSSRQRGAGTVAALFGVVVLVLLLAFGIDIAAQRLATLRDVEDASGGRVEIVADIFRALPGFPVTGAGLGTFGVVFPAYDTTDSAALASHAENEYAQLLFETGILGLLCFLGFVAALVAAAWRCARTIARFRDAPTIRYAAFGIGFGLVAVAVHSLSDFGQHVPGIAVVTASMAGLLVALPKVRRSEKYAVRNAGKLATLAMPGRWVLLAVALVLMAWSWWTTEQDRRARTLLRQATAVYAADLGSEDPLTSDRAHAALILAGSRALETTPGDAQLAFQLAALRYEALQRTVEGPGLADNGDILRRITADLRRAHQLAPTYGPPLALAGGIERFVLNDPAGAAAIRRARELTGYDSQTHFVDAQLTLLEGDRSAAMARFDKAVALDPGRRRATIVVLIDADEPDLAYRYAEGDGNLLEYLADQIEQRSAARTPDEVALARRARLEALALLRADAATGQASGSALRRLANIEWDEGQQSAALNLMARAVAREPTHTDWRLQYARMLVSAGQHESAVEQLRLLLRFKPDDDGAAALLEEAKLELIRQGRPLENQGNNNAQAD